MTTIEPIISDVVLVPETSATDTVSRWMRGLSWFTDRVNPILVKETRQALKSRQFSITFVFVLGACWVWSILGVAWQGPTVRYEASGPNMFGGYFLVLCFPLLVIVPYGAFRSLVVESEDKTFELLSITTLKSWQVISGKLGSAAVQMLIYLSAVSPCLAFTYLLRGIDVLSIVTILVYVSGLSLGLSLLSLLLATLPKQRHWQVLLSVLLILALFGIFWVAMIILLEMSVASFVGFDEAMEVHLTFLCAFLSYFALAFCIATGRISFPGSNRSTATRWVLVIQQAILVGWCAYASAGLGTNDVLMLGALLLAFFQWGIAGSFLTSESSDLSLRVRRELPQSFIGRIFCTWMNPGSGTGYVLTLASYVALLICSLFLVSPTVHRLFSSPLPGTANIGWRTFLFGLLSLCYLAIYLGLGRLIMNFWRKYGEINLAVPILVQCLLVSIGCGIPMIIQMMSEDLRIQGYTVLQATNFVWTLEQAIDNKLSPIDQQFLLVVLPGAALVIFLCNLPSVAREVQQVRLAKPMRVAEEDAALVAALLPAQGPTSPWDQ